MNYNEERIPAIIPAQNVAWKKMKCHKLITIALRLGIFATLAFCASEIKADTSVTLAITRIKEVHCDEGLACPDDYYPKVDIDAQGLDNGRDRFCCTDGTDVSISNWIFKRTINPAHNVVSIHIELWDQDDSSGDDQINITSLPNKSQDLQVDLNTCTWTGAGGISGLLNTQSSTTGNGKDSAQLYFTITTSTDRCTDTDGDGLLDIWEKNGLNGVNLQAMGADPQKVDLFLQLDYLAVPGGHTHQPLKPAIQQVVQAFANAPVVNADGTTGIQLHIDVGPIYGVGVITTVTGNDPRVKGTFGDYGGGGHQIPEAGNTVIDSYGKTGNPGTNFFALKNMNTNRDNIFRYGMFVHQTNARKAVNDCTSGVAKGIPGVNFMISLGGVGLIPPSPGAPPVLGPCSGTDINNNSVGSVSQQAGTLMHEFGHTLGLHHGGDDDTNNKPNYLSVMSYLQFPASTQKSEQACGVVPRAKFGIPGGCDYSRIKLPALNENSLDECLGIDGGLLGSVAIDFNNNGRTEGVSNCQPPNNANVTANVNFDTSSDANNNGVQDGSEPPIIGTLNGFQDWGALIYNFRTVTDFTTAGAPTDQEPDPQTIDNAHQAFTRMVQPKLISTLSGPSVGVPGATLAFNARLENPPANGARGPAMNVVAVTVQADGSTQTTDIDNVVLGAVVNTPVTYVVPCSANDGAVLPVSVRFRGVDLANNPLDVTGSANTTVEAPVMTVAEAADNTVHAGEVIQHLIQFQNTGAGAALDVVVIDTVPEDVYYSLALDRGTGPRPSSVVRNEDGTRTLMWSLGMLAAHSHPAVIRFTARPTLLALDGSVFTNQVAVEFKAGASCPARVSTASATTRITVSYNKQKPLDYLHWKKHYHAEPEETYARIQATDQRFDGNAGTAPDGALSRHEIGRSLSFGNFFEYIFHWNRPRHLRHHLLALYFNLATSRASADDKLDHHPPPGLVNVRDAALHAEATLLVPYREATEEQYHIAKEVLKEINH